MKRQTNSAPIGCHFQLPPGPRTPAIWQLVQWSFHPIPMLNHCRQRYGETFTLRFAGFGTFVMLTSPDAIKEVFQGDPQVLHSGEANRFLRMSVGDSSVLVLDDEAHRRQRHAQIPAFKGERMRQYFHAIHQRTLREITGWPVGRPFPVDRSMRDITLGVILQATLGLESGAPYEPIAARVKEIVEFGATPWALILTRFALATRLDRARWTPYARNVSQLDDLLFDVIGRRRSELEGPRGATVKRDILTDLLQAQHDDGTRMSDREVRDAVLTALLAGHETTATALAWALELILDQPDVLSKLLDELHRVTKGDDLQADHVTDLVYLDATIREVLRYRTIIAFVTRLLKAPMAIAGHTYPAGVQLCPCIHLVHRREDLYPQPEQFRPERFLERRFGPHEWLPFGGGHRVCLGMQFALFEMRVVLATILSTVRLGRPPGAVSRVARRGVVFAPSDGTPVIRLPA